MKYNKGEWSEAYAFIKLIGESEVYAADENLNKIDNKSYSILKIFKDEIEKYYENDTKNGIVNIIDYKGNIVSSLNLFPINCIPIGILLLSTPHGIDIPGNPAIFKDTVQISAKYISNGLFDFSPILKAGTGDVLSGLICSLLSQGYNTINAAVTSSLVHGKLSCEFKNNFSLTPLKLISRLDEVVVKS